MTENTFTMTDNVSAAINSAAKKEHIYRLVRDCINLITSRDEGVPNCTEDDIKAVANTILELIRDQHKQENYIAYRGVAEQPVPPEPDSMAKDECRPRGQREWTDKHPNCRGAGTYSSGH